jgi:hypothetical protein
LRDSASGARRIILGMPAPVRSPELPAFVFACVRDGGFTAERI